MAGQADSGRNLGHENLPQDDLRREFLYRNSEPPSDGPLPPVNRPPADQSLFRELALACGLVVFGAFFILYMTLLVELLVDNSGDEVTGEIVVVLGTLTITAVMVRISGISPVRAISIFGLLTLTAVVIGIANGNADGDFNLLGIPASLFNSLLFVSIQVTVAWLFIGKLGGDYLRRLRFIWPESPSAFPIALGAWFLALVGLMLWSLVVSQFDWLSPPDNAQPIIESANNNLFLAWLIVGIMGPIAEEVFFRGYLLSRLRTKLSVWPAILISTVVFSIFHFDPQLYVPIGFVGIVLGWVYLKTRSIWPAIFLHGLHNSFTIFLAS